MKINLDYALGEPAPEGVIKNLFDQIRPVFGISEQGCGKYVAQMGVRIEKPMRGCQPEGLVGQIEYLGYLTETSVFCKLGQGGFVDSNVSWTEFYFHDGFDVFDCESHFMKLAEYSENRLFLPGGEFCGVRREQFIFMPGGHNESCREYSK